MTDKELRDLRLRHSLPAKEMVDVVRAIYPKFDKPLLSKCENGSVYGVQLRADAADALRMEFLSRGDSGPVRSKHGRHRLTCRITARLPDEVYVALQRKLKADGYATVQELLTDLVEKYIKEDADEHT